MLFRCMPVPGTTTPEHDPFEQVTAGAAARRRPSPTMWVVLPSRERTSVATVSSASSRQEALQVALAAEARRGTRRRGRGWSRRSPRRSRAASCGRVEPLEDAERVGDQDPAGRGRRVGEHLAAAVARPAPARARSPGRRRRSSRGQEPAALEHPVAARARPRRPRRGSPVPRRRAGRAGRPAREAGSCRPSRSSRPSGA